ncbi:MAG: hypothetical protein EOO62_05630 [Hymenobacter sp.]|nr:MAG: hypothetical protein EOO62_05630 [Hymenobacter sp.]
MNQSFIQVDFVWAGLIFEYVAPSNCLAFVQNNTGEAAKLIVTIQLNTGVASVSKTGIESVKSIASIFHVVNQEYLTATALRYGFEEVGVEENYLPNGKFLLTYTFLKSSAVSRE